MSSQGRISALTAWLILALVLGAGVASVVKHYHNGQIQVTAPESVSAGDSLQILVTSETGDQITVAAAVDGEDLDGSPDDGSDDPSSASNSATFETDGLTTGDVINVTINVGSVVITRIVEVG